MSRNDQLWLLEVEEELQRLQDLSTTLPQDAPSQLLRLMLQQVKYLMAEAERIAAMTEGAAEPLPWWQEWQHKQARGFE
jgi:hypothetical protein